MTTDQNNFASKLANTKVVVFGGSSGIGYAVAAAAIESGATVIISSSSATRVQEAIASLSKIYPKRADHISGHAIDLSNDSTIESSLEAFFTTTGKVDHIIYTAGDALSMIPIDAMTTDAAKQAGQVRFFTPLLVAKHAAKSTTPGPASSITFTAGVVAEKPIPGWPLVSAYASAMHGLVRALAIDLKPVRVNVVQPGVVDTGLYAASGIPGEVKEGILADAASKLPIGKVATPGDVAEAYLYLMRSEAVTGEVVNVNGGSLLV